MQLPVFAGIGVFGKFTLKQCDDCTKEVLADFKGEDNSESEEEWYYSEHSKSMYCFPTVWYQICVLNLALFLYLKDQFSHFFQKFSKNNV